jgi:hypothetical protein
MAKDNIEKLTIRTVNHLFSTINDQFTYWPDYIYRGHAQSDWLLEPTLTRVLNQIKYKDKDELVLNHFNKFCLDIRGRRGISPKPLTENETWALGQHYGLHTPLLDWSQSPYVALFFAVIRNEKSTTKYRTLWALNAPDISVINEYYEKASSSNKSMKVELVNPTLDENSRLINQNGLFTKVLFKNDIEKWIENAPDLGGLTLFKINFSESLRDKIVSTLDLMNINFSTLFPDLVGSSLYTNSRLEQIDFINNQQDDEWKKSKST